MTTSLHPELDLTVSRIIKAPRSAIWNAWAGHGHAPQHRRSRPARAAGIPRRLGHGRPSTRGTRRAVCLAKPPLAGRRVRGGERPADQVRGFWAGSDGGRDVDHCQRPARDPQLALGENSSFTSRLPCTTWPPMMLAALAPGTCRRCQRAWLEEHPERLVERGWWRVQP